MSTIIKFRSYVHNMTDFLRIFFIFMVAIANYVASCKVQSVDNISKVSDYLKSQIIAIH